MIISRGARATYSSCWETIKLKALNAGIPLGETIDDYKDSVDQALEQYLRDYGQPVAIFRAELHLWRDLCMERALLYFADANRCAVPEEYFPGINPVTGERNWTTGADLDRYRSQTEEQQDTTPQTNVDASNGTQSTSHHQDDSTHIEQARSTGGGWQRPKADDIQQQSSAEGVSQGQEFPETVTTDGEENHRSERRSRSYSRSRSPEVFSHRPDIRQRSPLRESFNQPIPVAPHGTHQTISHGSSFPSNRDAFNYRGSPQMMLGGFQNSRGAYNRGLSFRGGRGTVPWATGNFQKAQGATQNLRGNPQNCRGSFQNDRGSFQNQQM
jgi:hypothetical protein